MRTVTIMYTKAGFTMEDSDGQYVNVEIQGDRALFVSELHGDEDAKFGNVHKDEAVKQGLVLMGVLGYD